MADTASEGGRQTEEEGSKRWMDRGALRALYLTDGADEARWVEEVVAGFPD